MATSGSATFNLDLVELIEEAYERVGAEMRTGYDLKTARRSLNLMFADWANRGINMWTMVEGSIALEAETARYTLPADTVDIVEHSLREGTTDTALSRVSVSDYAALPNKSMAGAPLQLMVSRATAAPAVTVWPVPATSGTYTLVYWRLRRIEDAVGGTTTMDVPFRFLNAMTAGLAYYLALKVPTGIQRIDILKAQYEEAWGLAADEDREKASTFFVPGGL